MRKLSTIEKKIFRYIDNKVDDIHNIKQVLKILKEHFGFGDQESRELYVNWYYSKGEDYENFEVSDDSKLSHFVKKIIAINNSEEIDEYIDYIYDNNRDFLKKLYGNSFFIECGAYNSKKPCIIFGKDGINIELDRVQWENYFSGIFEDDLWVYYNYISSSNYDYYDVYEDEMNYLPYDDDTIEYLENLALISGQPEWPGKTGGIIENNEIDVFLKKSMPSNYYSDFVDEVLQELSTLVTYTKIDAVREEYESNIKYDTNTTKCIGSDYCIYIPYDELLDIIQENNLINLSQLEDIGVNPDLYLGDVWYDTWIDDKRNKELIVEINSLLSRYIDNIMDDYGIDLEELKDGRKYILKLFRSLNLYETTKDQFLSNDGKIVVNLNDVDYKNKKIKFKYEDEYHIVPYEDFPNWVQGSVLDLNESVRFGKRLLKEDKETINKISIFDFDGTLMDTPNQDQGKKEWEKIKKEKYPYKGWWDKPESLDDSVFDIRPIESTISDYEKEKSNPNTLVIMLTGRIPHLSEQVEELLSLYNLNFDEYHYKGNGSTLNSKKNTIKSLLNRYPNVKTIEMWEDRLPHIKSFGEFGKDNDINIKVNKVSR